MSDYTPPILVALPDGQWINPMRVEAIGSANTSGTYKSTILFKSGQWIQTESTVEEVSAEIAKAVAMSERAVQR